MAMTPAEKQSAYRARKAEALRAELDALRAAAAQARPDAAPDPIGPNLGPKTPLTEEEVEYLRPFLRKFRNNRSAAEERRTTIEETMSKLPPEDKARIDEQMTARERARAARQTARKNSRPLPGQQMWALRTSAQGVENMVVPVDIVLVDKAVRVAYPGNILRALKHTFNSGWQTTEGYLYRTREEAFGFMYGNPFIRPFRNTSVEELRKLRSKHHPDRNGDADTCIYQLVIEELDRRK